MKYRLGCLLIIVSLYYSSPVFAGEIKNIPVAPPELVRCESNAHCDYEPMLSFHRPRSAQEKALDAILKIEGNIKDKKGYYLYLYVTRISANPYSDLFDKMITSSFRHAVSGMEANAVLKTCGGKYSKGEECGLEINPITCTQDDPLSYFYHTLETKKNLTRIASAWSEKAAVKSTVTYQMTYDNGHWKLDGVSCDNQWRGMLFNIE